MMGNASLLSPINVNRKALPCMDALRTNADVLPRLATLHILTQQEVKPGDPIRLVCPRAHPTHVAGVAAQLPTMAARD